MKWDTLKIWLGGVLAGNLVGGGLMAIPALAKSLPQGWVQVIAIPSVLLAPFVGGMVASYVWRTLAPRIGATLLWSTILCGASIAIAAVFLREGVICLIMLIPIYLGLVIAGALVGRLLFKPPNGRMHLVVFPVLILLVFTEIATRSEEVGVVSDEILIQAPPEKVWPELTAFSTIPAKPDFWLFRLGLPYPESTISEGDFVGARRECVFSGAAVFKEAVVELEPNKVLTFDILESPPDPELIGHLTPKRGRFTLRDNGNGTTTLTGDTWYVLHVRPLGYFDWWTQHIFRAVHLRVMEDIRRRAETS